MLNTFVVSFYNNFGLMFKGSEDTATKALKVGPFRPSRC